jgi:hypothetical protein
MQAQRLVPHLDDRLPTPPAENICDLLHFLLETLVDD